MRLLKQIIQNNGNMIRLERVTYANEDDNDGSSFGLCNYVFRQRVGATLFSVKLECYFRGRRDRRRFYFKEIKVQENTQSGMREEYTDFNEDGSGVLNTNGYHMLGNIKITWNTDNLASQAIMDLPLENNPANAPIAALSPLRF